MKKFLVLTLFIFLIIASSAFAATYYGDSANVDVAGTTSNYAVTIGNQSLTAGATYKVTVYAEDTEGNSSTTEWSFTVASEGTGTATITAPTNGTLYTAPDSRTINLTGTYTGSYSTMTYTCPTCTVTAGNLTFSGGNFSKSIELGTSGYGENIISNPTFDSTSVWYLESGWAFGTGVITGTNATLGFSQTLDTEAYDWVRSCITTSSYSSGNPYYSQWSLFGSGSNDGISVTSGAGEHCNNMQVKSPARDLYIIGYPAFTGSISDIYAYKMGTKNVISVYADGVLKDTIYLSHFTAEHGNSSILYSFPFDYQGVSSDDVDTAVPVNSDFTIIIVNPVSTISEGSITVDVAGVSYRCADTDTTTCTEYSDENGAGYTVTINPATNLSYSTFYKMIVNADYLSETEINFGTTRIGGYASNISFANSVITGSNALNNFVVTDTTAPTVTTAAIYQNGTSVQINFSEDVVIPASIDGLFNLDCTTTQNIILNSVSGSGDSRTLTAASTIYSSATETCDLDYTGSTDDIEDTSGNDLAVFSNTPVTNNSLQTAGTDPTIWVQNDDSYTASVTLLSDKAMGQRFNTTVDPTSIHSIEIDIGYVTGEPEIECRLGSSSDLSSSYTEAWTGLRPILSTPLILESLTAPSPTGLFYLACMQTGGTGYAKVLCSGNSTNETWINRTEPNAGRIYSTDSENPWVLNYFNSLNDMICTVWEE